jgi:hypothetical protein
MTPGQKVEAIARMWRLCRETLATQIRSRHPDWDEPAVWAEVRGRLIYGTSWAGDFFVEPIEALRDIRLMVSCTPLDLKFIEGHVARLGLGAQWGASR